MIASCLWFVQEMFKLYKIHNNVDVNNIMICDCYNAVGGTHGATMSCDIQSPEFRGCMSTLQVLLL